MPQIGDISKKKNFQKLVWAACLDCGKERWVDYRNGEPVAKRCRICALRITQKSFNRYGSANGSWKGGRTKVAGYWFLLINPDNQYYLMASHKKKGNKSGHYIAEHRYIIAQRLGRCLESWEVVHHINGDKEDNRLENLKLLPSSREHFPTIRWQTELNRRDKRITQLESRVTQLEAENILLKSQEVKV